MFIATVVKRKKADLWVVVQDGVPVENGHVTCGKIVYKGPGKIKVAEAIRKCHAKLPKLKPVAKPNLDPSAAALGLTNGSERRWTHRMSISYNDYGCVSGGISLGSQFCPISLGVRLALTTSEIDEPFWADSAWYALKRTFEYAEQFKAGPDIDWLSPPID